jgi:NAD(P)-dependent dehydrogenase (short-subunit alcohol dehydrogenase family)
VLVEHGAEVVMAGHDPRRLEAAVARQRDDGATAHPLLVDLADLSSVRAAAHEAVRLGPIHLLVNAAGVMAPPYQRTIDGFELQFAVNVLGHFALTGLLWPQLVASGGARVVSLSSQAHRMARRAPLEDPRKPAPHYRRWRAYADSCLAVLLLTLELDRRARAAGAPVTSMAAHPGLARTGTHAGARPGAFPGRPGGGILDAVAAALGAPPSLAALPVLMAATAPLPGATYVGPSGPGEVRGAPQVVRSSRLARDPVAARRLWEVAQRATGVAYP